MSKKQHEELIQDMKDIYFLDRKCKAALVSYEDGVPLKDVWNEEDTIRLMKSYIYVMENWSGYE